MAVPVAKNTVICKALVFMLLGGWAAHIIDVNGSFCHQKVQKRIEKLYSLTSILLMKKTNHGLKPMSIKCWKLFLKITKKVGHIRKSVNPSMYLSKRRMAI